MLVKIEDKNNIEKQLSFKVEQTKVDAVINDFVKEIAPRVEPKGFRKGTAPASVIKSQFKDIILAECSARMVHEEVSDTIRLKNLKVVGSPILIEGHRAKGSRRHVGEFTLDGSFVFDVLADFEPQVTVTIPSLTISETMPTLEQLVDTGLRQVQVTMSQLSLVERVATDNDQVSIEFLDGSNRHASIAIPDTNDTLSSNKVLVGKSTGDEFEVELKSGQRCQVKVSAVFERTLPELNDEFAQSALFSSLEEMRADIASKQKADFSSPLRAKLYAEILTQLMEANKIDVPSRWIDNEILTVCKRVGLKAVPAKETPLYSQIEAVSERNVKSNLILDAIYRDNENIQMSADEAFRVVEDEAKRVGQAVDDVLTHLRNTNQYDSLMNFHERNKTIDFLISQAAIKQEQA